VSGPASPPTSEETRWTARAYLVVAFGGGLVALAVALANPVPLFAGLPLLLAPLLAGGRLPARLSSVDLEWRATGLGPDVGIEGRVRGDFGPLATDVTIRVTRPVGVVETEPLRTVGGPDGLRFTLRWRLPEPSIVLVPPASVVWRDPLGLTVRQLPGSRPSLAVQRAPPWPRRGRAVRLERLTTHPGEVRSRLVGSSGDFYGVREAAPGEPPRRINWWATARVGRVLANDYQLDRTGDLVIVLDRRPSALGPELDERLLGVARAAAYALAESLLQNKIPFGYASFGEFVQALPLSTGRVHRLRVLRAIVASRRAPVVGPAERCALGLARFYRPGVTTLIISSWTGEPTANLVPYVQRRGFPVVLLSPSPLPLREGTGGLEAPDELLARRIERLERRAQLSELWSHGPVVDWTDYWSLEPLARILRRPSPKRVS
jgi:uncharacterized protein (DUF58 family)